MADKSKIEWTDATWNPTTGCSKVSAGCKHCYAERVFPRVYGSAREFTDVQEHPDRLHHPLRWRAPRRVFVNSMSDLFHEDVSAEFIDRVFAVMALCPQHTFQVLTKRPERMLELMQDEMHERVMLTMQYPEFMPADGVARTRSAAWPLPNVWIGVSVEDQATANERIPALLATPAARRFISYEPALGPVNFRKLQLDPTLTLDALTGAHTRTVRGSESEILDGLRKGTLDLGPLPDQMAGLDWIIAGGESGPRARPAHPDWFRSARDQCAAAFVSYFFKQWGEWAPYVNEDHFTVATDGEERHAHAWLNLDGTGGACWIMDDDGGWSNWTGDPPAADPEGSLPDSVAIMGRLGKKRAGRELDGKTHDEFPRP